MSDVNARLASLLPGMLQRHGFDATLQQRPEDTSGDFEISSPTWSTLATVKAVWDNPRLGSKGLNDGAPASSSTRFMTIAYREDLKDTATATRTRVVVNGVASNILATAVIGGNVGLRLSLATGTEPA